MNLLCKLSYYGESDIISIKYFKSFFLFRCFGSQFGWNGFEKEILREKHVMMTINKNKKK